MKRRAPGGTDTHEYCNVCDARTPFLRQCPSASVALIDKCYDGATNHSAGFATLGLYSRPLEHVELSSDGGYIRGQIFDGYKTYILT
jgi:hypothetical protein